VQLHQRLKQPPAPPAADGGARAAAATADGTGADEPAGTSGGGAAAAAASTGANPFLAPPSVMVLRGGQPGGDAAGMGPNAAGGQANDVGAPGATAFRAVLDAAAADGADVDVRDRGGAADGLDWKYVHHVDTVTGVWLIRQLVDSWRV
jgi:hypothetical protein